MKNTICAILENTYYAVVAFSSALLAGIAVICVAPYCIYMMAKDNWRISNGNEPIPRLIRKWRNKP